MKQASAVGRMFLGWAIIFVLLFIAGVQAIAQTCVPAPSGIIAWWPFDETSGIIAQDIAGSHPGVYFGGPTPATGKVGGALHFNGGNFIGAGDSDLWAFGAIDKTKPVITGSRSPAPNATGWNNTNVIVSFSCADVGSVPSGIATNAVSGQTLSVESAGQSVTSTGSCMDKAGNAADPVTVRGINIDKTPPAITVAATPTTLWPPNGKMVPVTIAGKITDTGSGVNAGTATYAVTDEYGLVQPSGHITLGGNGSYSFTIQLQASRNGDDKDGRQYTITVSAQDNAGTKGSVPTSVTVPHDQGK